jgi:pyridoxine 5'-phosphate synthase PdxJ
LSVLLANVTRGGEVESQHFGHLIVAKAVIVGIEKAVRDMLALMR